jgi:Integrase core domain
MPDDIHTKVIDLALEVRVTDTLDQALTASGLDHVNVVHRPRLLSDNGSSYIAGDLAEWLEDKGIEPVRGAPYHPQTQGKIERWHQTLKNRILLHNHYLPSELQRQIEAFMTYYKYQRYHESINNLTPADGYLGRTEAILAARAKIKRATIANRRLQHQLKAGLSFNPNQPEPPFENGAVVLNCRTTDNDEQKTGGVRFDDQCRVCKTFPCPDVECRFRS